MSTPSNHRLTTSHSHGHHP
ncbi:hypothetical protein JMJ77_0001614 [Colletotrichum scovillei]|uniref:Uncharacterized protein n=1 Tax=Colletotrichum scovillei TaxID=1209932 RepID=A0A9P7R7G6_9PEZI|nr:hypothetical protein JMJ77_0001614 [Colletotrichum scovillei]KAG7070023.1 hypothetical protein JMJ76_0001281 [Colletotrichum scovillei]